MASVVASKVALPKPVFLMDILASPSASRKTVASAGGPSNTGGAPPRSSPDGVKDSSAAADRPRERDPSIPKLFAGDTMGPFDEAAMLDLLLALAEDGGAASMTGFSPRGWWINKEDGDAVQLKLAMPGLGKEHVKMRVEKNTLVVKGEGDKESEGSNDKGPARYSYCIGLPTQSFKMDQIKAEMKNGVLRVTVPKIKGEDHKDVFEIKVE